MAGTKESEQRTEALQECNKYYTTGTFRYLRLLIHSFGATHFAYAAFYWKDISRRATWAGKFRFLTYLDLLLQATYHGIALLNDLFGSNAINSEPAPILRKVRDFTFSVLAFPMSNSVCISFWIVYAYDRELIFPRVLDTCIPGWLNHIAHSNVAIFCFLDMLTCFRHYPKRRNGILLSSLTMFSYIAWLHVLRFYNGRWAYPILNAFNKPLRYLALSTLVGFNMAFYLCGELINNVIWTPVFRLLQE